ncbi:MAG: trypsin-like peptidase domain-containing protein [Candidatus Nealsonbacteria bacterium]|nr:trypsin-like peptidase domain-containing protein [Candidatus Nealsonbacteria bacterium]
MAERWIDGPARPSCRISRHALLWLAILITCGSTSATGLFAAETEQAAPAKAPLDNPPKNAAELKALEELIHATVDRVSPAVVAVSGGGSGVVVSKDGYVLTVAHVGMRAGRTISVTFADGKRVAGKTLGNDRGMDAGMIKLSGKGPWPCVELGRSDDLKAGLWCVTLGYPVSFEHGKPAAVRIGRVLRTRTSTIFTDGAIMGGDSGGGLFDLQGKLIGIGTRCDDTVKTNLYVPIDRFHDHWDRLAKGEDFDGRVRVVAFLGVGPGDKDAAGDENETGKVFRIGDVIAGSAAEKAGIKAGDVMLKFADSELDEYTDLPPLVEKRKPGEKIEIEIRRGEETLKIKATLGKRNG